MNKEIASLIGQIARIRNVDTTYVSETLKMSIIAGLKRRFGPDVRADVEIDPELGDLKVLLTKTVVDEVKNDALEISPFEAKKAQGLKSESAQGAEPKVGEEVKVELPASEIGRIAIRKASEELMLKLREAERSKLYDEYMKKRSEIVTGTIQKIGRDEIVVNLGLVEASLGAQEQLKTDHYRQGAPIKALIYRVEKTPIGPRILLSRTHPDFLRRLLAKEIPEIRQNVVEIRAVARAPSFRSKVAVFSNDERVDPVGACVGYRKSRIENVIKELSGEKIDIVQWSKDAPVFITRALGPARVKQVIPEDDTYIVVVPDSEFSIAIGKKGQNVWLASLLVGSKLEVLKETDFQNRAVMHKASRISIVELGLEPDVVTKLQDNQVLTAFDVLSIPAQDLAGFSGLSQEQIVALKKRVGEQFTLTEEEHAELAETTGQPVSKEPAQEAAAKTPAAEDMAPETSGSKPDQPGDVEVQPGVEGEKPKTRKTRTKVKAVKVEEAPAETQPAAIEPEEPAPAAAESPTEQTSQAEEAEPEPEEGDKEEETEEK